MDYCGPLGLPRSEFLRWGRDDRDAAIVWQMRRQAACSACGTRPEEWDPDLGGSDIAYVAEIRPCRGCETQAAAQAQITEAHGKGAHVVLVRHGETT